MKHIMPPLLRLGEFFLVLILDRTYFGPFLFLDRSYFGSFLLILGHSFVILSAYAFLFIFLTMRVVIHPRLMSAFLTGRISTRRPRGLASSDIWAIFETPSTSIPQVVPSGIGIFCPHSDYFCREIVDAVGFLPNPSSPPLADVFF